MNDVCMGRTELELLEKVALVRRVLPQTCPKVVVPKISQPDEQSRRLCTDYRPLNNHLMP